MSRYDDSEMLGRALCVFLRHQPEQVGIVLNEEGWTDVYGLINGMNAAGRFVTIEQIKRAVNLDNNGRFELSGTHIRCVQGHSSRLGVTPPLLTFKYDSNTVLYHGTSVNSFKEHIVAEGLKPMGRGYVYLSQCPDMALEVGSRRQKNGGVILLSMKANEIASVNECELLVTRSGVVLCKLVPPQLLKVLTR
ncbi:TPA: hypothetical protein I7730_01295 [Vibrio vulnificus]|uniref:Probable RNA 2'-phosphotransferase n=1 Tax=Vibrio vulnificus TaxID=672 RepID=A0A8H9K717_VIBVL|nr:RNA 2'-phosphotransferase [Vibrio vulnificus]HAS8538432.1 hypothetical protein [Vibrio vulnificus]